MTETNVSASHFRVHLKEIANSVKAGEQVVMVERHGCKMFAVVSMEDLEFLRKHKYGQTSKTAPPAAPPEADTITLVHPELMPIELVEEAYELSYGTVDLELIEWRRKAWRHIWNTRGKRPEKAPLSD